jgi:hypothetical protein
MSCFQLPPYRVALTFWTQSDEEGGYIYEADAHTGLESLGSRVTKFELPKMDMLAPVVNPFLSPRALEATDKEELVETPSTLRQIVAQGPADTTHDISLSSATSRVEGWVRPKSMAEFAATHRGIDHSPVASGSDSNHSSVTAAEEPKVAKKQLPTARRSGRTKVSRRNPSTAASLKRRRRDTSASTESGSEDDFDRHEKSSTPGRRAVRSKRSVPASQVLQKSDRVLRTRTTRKYLRE